MSEANQILETVISNFSIEKFNRFFREKSRQFVTQEENYARYNDEDFKNGLKLGEIHFSDGDSLIFCAFEVTKELTERTGKKAQYQKAKDILKSGENQRFSAGIFIFYDPNGNYRFSLVYPESIGTRRQWNNFRRFTYFVSKEFTNKTFKQRIGDGDFSTLAKIKDAFSVEKVTKEFYESIANWYFWAVDNCQFPINPETDKNGKSNIAIIRLITRMIFIWFMRERGLMPKDLFEEAKINAILKNISAEDSTYYTAILQNLFFATLSTKKEERQFGSEVRGYKGYNPDFGNQYVFRYIELFKKPDEIQNYFGDIPFLNGGLFECLDDKKNGIIIDGFSRTKKNQPTVPNFLFFSQEKITDLNKAYGTTGKTYKVHGLLDILSSFNFTIDENSPDDADVALDPELLGRVFENLLASFNPETSTTARKATGSYYTPREIVDYMVTESLKAYFKTHLEEIENTDEKLENLFTTGSEENPFDKEQSKKLVELIESVKIVDPAVGSGAFPMGVLNKLVFILGKVDHGNELWKQAQLKAADGIPDPSVRREAKIRIEEFFKGKNADYGRKLYLIQRCIYGVDIQQIAVEIAKLRFFISLLVDEKIDKDKENWGIEPLPNLDFKIMQGNSLISEFLGIDFDNNSEEDLRDKINILDSEIKQVRADIINKDAEFRHLLNKQGKKDEILLQKIKLLTDKKRKLEKEFVDIQKLLSLSIEEEGDSLVKVFEQKKIDFQNESDKDKRAKLKTEVEDLMIMIFEEKLQKKYADLKVIEARAQSIPNLKTQEEYIKSEKSKIAKKHGLDLENIENQLREFTSKKKTSPFFPWKLYFAEVFEKGGFNIVIANPPYIGEKGHKELFREVKNGGLLEKFYQRKVDLFYLFFHLALNLGKQDSSIAFITTNYYLTATGGKKLREDFKNRAIISRLINFNELKIFESALGQHNMITILQKRNDENAIAKTCITKRKGDSNSAILQAIVYGIDAQTDYFQVAQRDLYEGEECYIRLTKNSKVSDNSIQTVLQKLREQGTTLGFSCNVNQGLRTGADKVSPKHIQEYSLNDTCKAGDGIFILNDKEIKSLKLNRYEKNRIKPLFKNSDIRKYIVNETTQFNIIDLFWPNDRELSLDYIPNIIKHLTNYKPILEGRKENANGIDKAIAKGKYYYGSVRRKLDFTLPKIVSPQRSKQNTFAYTTKEWFASADVYYITQKDSSISLKYILAILNSKLYYLWLYHRGKRKGEMLELYQKPLSEIPIKKISGREQKPFVEIVDKILAITKSEDYLENPGKQASVKEYEKQIDQMIYELYDLTPEEIEIVENSGKK
jgi:adenine-specific DNA-methyltransferase